MGTLNNLQLSQEVDKKIYKKKLKLLQYEMLNAQQFLFNNKIGLIIVLEGMDAAGKGGAIKRLVERIDPRGYVVHPISAPQPHEHRYHYMHRFWRKLPQHGQIAVFDRSWYGRVLVERLEGFATVKEWKRGYGEINDFEKQLTDEDYIILKFWIHIDEEEQLRRFEERANDPYKAWKLTDEDWRNREKFEDYVAAAEDMFEKTNTAHAPWVLVEGNNKYYARIKVLEETIAHIERELDRRGLQITNVFQKESEKALAELEEVELELASVDLPDLTETPGVEETSADIFEQAKEVVEGKTKKKKPIKAKKKQKK